MRGGLVRLTQYLRSLEALATAGSLCNPILGMFDAETIRGEIDDKVSDSWWTCRTKIAIVTDSGAPTKFITNSELFASFVTEDNSNVDDGNASRTIGQDANLIAPEMLISEGEILRSMLTKVEQFAGSSMT